MKLSDRGTAVLLAQLFDRDELAAMLTAAERYLVLVRGTSDDALSHDLTDVVPALRRALMIAQRR